MCFLEETEGDINMEGLPFLIRVAQYFSACFMSGHYPFFPLHYDFFKEIEKKIYLWKRPVQGNSIRKNITSW